MSAVDLDVSLDDRSMPAVVPPYGPWDRDATAIGVLRVVLGIIQVQEGNKFYSGFALELRVRWLEVGLRWLEVRLRSMKGANWHVDQHSVLAVFLPRLRLGQGMETRGQRLRLPLNHC